MRFAAVASDYDGTLACDGVVEAETLRALGRFRDSGRKLILVTGRILSDLQSVFPAYEVFDRVVAENGAVLYSPATMEHRVLANPPDPSFVHELQARGIPVGAVDVIVATLRDHEAAAAQLIREQNLELHLIRNNESVMILPNGIDKKSGFEAALTDLGLFARDVAGIGDAENDVAFLKSCGYSVAVANAIPPVKKFANMVTQAEYGAGVVEVIDMILKIYAVPV